MDAAVSLENDQVLRLSHLEVSAVRELLARFSLTLVLVADNDRIEGSYWGEPEAGVIARDVYARPDTPVHSLLHEACHCICMSEDRRSTLHRDAGGDDLEESAVCYLQILLADFLPGVGRQRLMRDMNAWGYSFRLGATEAWFERDAGDALQWLEAAGLVTSEGLPRWVLRQS